LTLLSPDPKNVDATSFQRRWPEYAQSPDDAKIREAALHLQQFTLLTEIKVVDHEPEPQITDKMVWDVFRLGATSAAVAEFCNEQRIPEIAFVVVMRGYTDLADNTRGFLSRLRFRSLDALANSEVIALPHLFFVTRSEVQHLKPA